MSTPSSGMADALTGWTPDARKVDPGEHEGLRQRDVALWPPRPLVADPALDALDIVENDTWSIGTNERETAIATIREALMQRLTADEARTARNAVFAAEGPVPQPLYRKLCAAADQEDQS